MGVPSLFRWLSKTYPQVILQAVPQNPTDNLYIDFNAIIHNSSSPSDGPNQTTVEGIMKNLEKNIDQIVAHCKPRKLLYLSTDGVAPRAKLVQQRTRRYRSVLDEEELKKNIVKPPQDEKTTSEDNTDNETGEISQLSVLVEKESDDQQIEGFDSNAITPGTNFMFDLEKEVQKFIENRIKTHENYKNLNVIFSTSRRPGEGEQKIMTVIRRTKNKNIKHTIYSPDADLIFLGASLHGRNIKIMREDLDFAFEQKKYTCEKCGKSGHLSSYCNNLQFQRCIFIDIQVLRTILDETFSLNIKSDYNLNRLIDDWIFMSFLAGNDFLPTLQCFDVRFNAIPILTEYLMKNFNQTNDYITFGGKLQFDILLNLFKIMSKDESRLYSEKSRRLHFARKRFEPNGKFEKIRLDTESGQAHYYRSKMKIYNEKDVISACREFIIGLSWINDYYLTGNTNWDWYYKYDYAPFLVDLAQIRKMPFLKGQTAPLTCLEQQMFILPPQSKHLVPKVMHKIFDTFPTDVKIDMFDKLLPWQGVIILPMVDIKKLQTEIRDRKDKLTYEEIVTMTDTEDLFFISKNSKKQKDQDELFESIRALYFEHRAVVKSSLDYDVILRPYVKYSMKDDELVVCHVQI